jgi:hypothetical protein
VDVAADAMYCSKVAESGLRGRGGMSRSLSAAGSVERGRHVLQMVRGKPLNGKLHCLGRAISLKKTGNKNPESIMTRIASLCIVLLALAACEGNPEIAENDPTITADENVPRGLN